MPTSTAPSASAAATDRPIPALVLLGIAVVSGSTLLLEISLTRYFSFRLWYHYAFMIISVALLGLSAASTVLAIVRPRLERFDTRKILAVGALLFGGSLLAARPALAWLTSAWTSADSVPSKFAVVAGYWAVLFVPFFSAGWCISWAMLSYAARISRAYAADLAGAGLGCVVAAWALSAYHPEQVFVFVAATALGTAVVLVASGARRRRQVGAVAVLVALAAGAVGRPVDPLVAQTITPKKGLARDLRAGARIVATRPSMNGRVDVVVRPTGRLAWGLNTRELRQTGRLVAFPEQRVIRIDGDAATAVTRFDGDFSKWAFATIMPNTLPYAMALQHKVLIIGPGGGMDVVNALGHGSKQVVGVEVNPRIIELMLGELAEFSGQIYHHPDVRIINSDGRNFVENTTESFDLIQLTLVDTFAAIASGALALSEDYLYTTEAFESYIRALTPDGYLSIGRTQKEALSLMALLHAATKDRSLRLDRQVFAVDNPLTHASLVVVFKNSPLTRREITNGLAFVERAQLRLVYAPGFEDRSRPAVATFLRDHDRDAFIAMHPSDIQPETDDKPFYFRASKWSSLLGTYAGGRANLLIMLAVAVLFAFGFIVAPLVRTSRPALRANGSHVLFFVFIGLGFILLELALIVRFSLFLGDPVRSFTVTLFALLLCSGVGSHLSRRTTARVASAQPADGPARRTPLLPIVAAAGIGLAYGLGLDHVLSALMGLGTATRMAITVALLAPLGVVMGMPMPIGIALLRERARELVLWGWGLNGVASVVGSIACVLIAQLVGYRAAFVTAALCYLLAAYCLRRALPAATS